MATYVYQGKGPVYLGKLTNGVLSEALLPVGNCSKLSLAVSEESKEMINYQSAGGGTFKKVSRIKSVEASMDLLEFSPKNLEIALRGEATAVTSGAVTDESHVSYQGGLVTFAYLPDTTQTITIKSEDGNTTYDVTDDYIVTRNGIKIVTGGDITNASTIKCSYTKSAGYIVESLVNSGVEYKLVFEGLNEAESGKAISVECYKVYFSPTSGLDLIGDDFGKLSVKGTLLADTTIQATGKSQYFRELMAD